MTKTPLKEDENVMKVLRPEIDQVIWGQLWAFAYNSPTFRVPYALVSRSKSYGKGGRRVGVWLAKGGKDLPMIWKWP